MTRLKRRTIWLTAAGAGVLALGIAVPSLASAQETSPTPSASASAAPGKPGAPQRQDELATALAKELGIDKDKVAAALTKIESDREANHPKPAGTAPSNADRAQELKSRLAAAVTAGKLTQAEADAIIKASEAGVLLGGPGDGPGHAGGK